MFGDSAKGNTLSMQQIANTLEPYARTLLQEAQKEDV
tara:strand:- start:1424 stop:1534 length:111 start_codon:yes stop_codon:yes gene_type:complete